MRIFNYVIELHTRARNRFTHVRLHRHEYYNHFCWWKISLVYGQPHLVPVRVCTDCREEVRQVGEDYLNYCESCQQIEGSTETITMEEYEAYQ